VIELTDSYFLLLQKNDDKIQLVMGILFWTEKQEKMHTHTRENLTRVINT
jgi:hypothetical protein